MKMRSMILVSVLAVCAGGVAWSNGSRPKAEKAAETQTGGAEVKAVGTAVTRPDAVVVYYFHGDYRCSRCMAFEAYAAEALKTAFGKELESGKLAWRVVNTDREENRHYVQDYQLVTKSLVIVEMKDGKQVRWKNLPEIWRLFGSKPDYLKYVQDETGEYLKGIK